MFRLSDESKAKLCVIENPTELVKLLSNLYEEALRSNSYLKIEYGENCISIITPSKFKSVNIFNDQSDTIMMLNNSKYTFIVDRTKAIVYLSINNNSFQVTSIYNIKDYVPF
jgi:hypothetical protein